MELKDSFVQNDGKHIITCCQISPESNHLAVGDSNGKITIYDINEDKKLTKATEKIVHETHYDWIKKRQVQPSILSMKWMKRYDSHNKLLTTNGVVVKLWKLKYLSFQGNFNSLSNFQKFPSQQYQWCQDSRLPSLHEHAIDEISLSHNEQYMLSLDGCSLMKWNFQKINKPFVINIPEIDCPLDFSEAIDQDEDGKIARLQLQKLCKSIKPITTAKFCHKFDNKMVYGSKYGEINYIDMRRSNSINPTLVFNQKARSRNIDYFISTVSDIDFPEDQNLIVSRDYIYTYIWDIRKPETPTFRAGVFPTINYQLLAMYQQSKIFDRFKVKVSSDGQKIMTNHYEQSFHQIFISNKRNLRHIHQNNEIRIEQFKEIDKSYRPLIETEVLNYFDYHKDSKLLAACTTSNIHLYSQNLIKHSIDSL